MKHLLGWLLVVLITACEGPRGPMGPPGDDGSPNSYVSPVYKINGRQWQYVTMPDGVSKGYMCEIADNKLLVDDYDYGAVNGYLYLDWGKPSEVKTPLPYMEIIRDDEGFTYTEHYTFEFMPGYITFYIKSDSPVPLTPPDVSYFQLVVTY